MPLILMILSLLPVPSGINSEHLSTRDQHVASAQAEPFTATEISPAVSPLADAETVMILVADYLMPSLEDQLNQLKNDLIAEGWSAGISTASGSSVEELRGLFQSTADLDGVILIGFLPCAWYEEDYWAEEEFPCELFLMDLDGVWGDADSDGIYDSHTGDVAPEIWIGRIDASSMEYGSEILMISDYLEKNHLYRTGAMSPPSRALTFIDDDWSYYTDCGLNYIYGSSGVTVVNSDNQTTAANYTDQLGQGYEFVHLMAHSCPWGHTFKVPSGMSGTVMAPEIAQINPNTAFLQLFSCSNARWVETGCLGNWYLFGTDTGLLVSGAAKTGSMLDFEYFYQPVGNGSCFGEAFRDWWQYQAQGGFTSDERAWFYGNALLGDPTLKPISSSRTFAGVEPDQQGTDGFQVSASTHSDCFPDAAWHGGTTAVAWLTGENGRLDVAARFHDDSGDSWSQVYTVDADEYWDNSVSVCFDNSGTPWLAWSDFEYATYSYRIKTAHGIPFENVSVAAPQEGYQVSPDLACTDRMWLAWQDWEAHGGRIILKTLTGTPYSCQLSDQGEWATCPSISPGPSGDLHALWVKSTDSGSSIMWSHGNENGFSAPQPITTGSYTSCHSPSIALVNDILVAAWHEDNIQSSVLASTWDGSSWSAPEELVQNSPEHLLNPVVCRTAEGLPGVCWQEGRADAVPMMSVLSEGEWSTPYQPITSSGPVWNPVPAGSRIYWAGNQGSDWNIYTELTTGIQEQETPCVQPFVAANPGRSALTLRLPENGEACSRKITILDISGRTVLSTEGEFLPGGFCTVNCHHLPAGVYSILINGSEEPERFTLLH